MVFELIRDKRILRESDRILHEHPIEVADADMTDLAGLDHRVESRDLLG